MEKERKIEIEKKNDRNRETEPGPIQDTKREREQWLEGLFEQEKVN